jgi:signal transduction histidine kinase
MDEGIGIPDSEVKYLFDRFFRASNATNIQGTGLGLHIVKRYVDLLKGTVSFSSEEGKGSIFTIEIPLTQDEKDFAY